MQFYILHTTWRMHSGIHTDAVSPRVLLSPPPYSLYNIIGRYLYDTILYSPSPVLAYGNILEDTYSIVCVYVPSLDCRLRYSSG
jgi:hypothetical protein